MTPIQSPTSPTFDSYPSTPLTPTFGHHLKSNMSSPLASPTLKLVTTFPFQPIVLRSPIPTRPPQSSVLKPTHTRNASSVSTRSFPSPADDLFHRIPDTPRTPGPNVSFQSLLSSGGPAREDGRQSRMAMRSPIIERVLSLPLRVNSTARTPYAEASSAVSSNLVNPSERLDEDMSITSPCSAYLPTQPFTTVIQTSVPPPRRSLSHSRTSSSSTIQEPSRTPIRKAKRSHSPPPRYHMVLRPSLASTLNNATPSRPDHYPFASAALRTAYHSVITHLSTTLVPLISVSTGLPHPEFPRSLLQYHLLTHAQLDSLARWYHQTEPATAESWQYPAIIPPFTSAALSMALGDGANSSAFDNVSLETKRRRWGRFIGLRGCESPTEEGEDVLERMERDWWRARERAREEEIAREKGWRGRW